MIDWLYLLTNGLWVVGAALALAIASFAVWAKSEEKTPFGEFFGRTQPKLGLLIAGLLFSVGLAFSVETLWQRIAWGILGAAALVYFLVSIAGLLKAK